MSTNAQRIAQSGIREVGDLLGRRGGLLGIYHMAIGAYIGTLDDTTIYEVAIKIHEVCNAIITEPSIRKRESLNEGIAPFRTDTTH